MTPQVGAHHVISVTYRTSVLGRIVTHETGNKVISIKGGQVVSALAKTDKLCLLYTSDAADE